MKLIAVTDDSHTVHELVSILSQAKDYVDYIHIREKSKTAHQVLSLVDLLMKEGIERGKDCHS